MILTKGEALRRGILILFLAIVLIGIVFGIGFGTYMCVMNSCYKHSTPFEYLESYDEVKSVFARNKKVLFPDLAALELGPSLKLGNHGIVYLKLGEIGYGSEGTLFHVLLLSRWPEIFINLTFQ